MTLNENSREHSVGFDFDAVEAPVGGAEEPKVYTHAEMLERMRWVMSYIRSKDRARVTVDCIYLALGDAELEQITMTSVGDAAGLTKAAISKRAKEVRRQLHLGINQNNKSPHASKRYASTNFSPVRLPVSENRDAAIATRQDLIRRARG